MQGILVEIQWVGLSVSPTNKTKERIYMLATLQLIVKNVLIFSTIIGLVVMVACTVFIIVCVINGDIKINIISGKDEKENK